MRHPPVAIPVVPAAPGCVAAAKAFVVTLIMVPMPYAIFALDLKIVRWESE